MPSSDSTQDCRYFVASLVPADDCPPPLPGWIVDTSAACRSRLGVCRAICLHVFHWYLPAPSCLPASLRFAFGYVTQKMSMNEKTIILRGGTKLLGIPHAALRTRFLKQQHGWTDVRRMPRLPPIHPMSSNCSLKKPRSMSMSRDLTIRFRLMITPSPVLETM